MVPIMLPAMVHLTAPSANVFEKSATSILMLRICRLDVGGMFEHILPVSSSQRDQQ